MRLVFRPASTDAGLQAVSEVKSRLGLRDDLDEFRIVSINETDQPDTLMFRGRSFLSAMFFLSQAVEPPPAHIDHGTVTVTRDAAGEVGRAHAET